MARAIPNLDKYKKFCDQLKSRRLRLGLSQIKIAEKAEYSNTNIICILENKYAAIPISKAALLAKAYNLDTALFCQSIAYTRHPEIWDFMYTMMETDENITCQPKEELEKIIENFIENIDKLSINATK